MKIIDTHGYIGTHPLTKRTTGPKHYASLKKFIADKHGCDTRFLIMSYSKDDNPKLGVMVSEEGVIFNGGVLQFNPNTDPHIAGFLGHTPVDDLEAMINKGGVVALKNNTAFTRLRVNHDDMLPFADVAIAYGIPMILHCSSTGQDFVSPQYIRELLGKRPELKLVLAHFGGLNRDYFPESIRLAEEYPNVFLNTAGISGEVRRYDTSCLPHSLPRIIEVDQISDRWTDLFVDAAERLRGKILFASDFPELSFTLHPIDKVRPEIQEEIFYHTPKKVFGLKDC